MTKPFYEEYVTHAARFYAKNPALKLNQPGLKRADVDNWNACNDVIRNYSPEQQAIILGVFRSKCALRDAVSAMAAQLRMPDGAVWQLLNNFSRDFAQKRGLV